MTGLLALRTRIARGEITVAQALREARERILAGDGALRSFVAVSPEQEPAELPHASLPLAGVAVGVKDIIDTADLPTEMGLPAVWGGWRPRADAAIVGMVRRAGGRVAGKTSTTALAYLDPTPTLNPHDPSRTPGGSSSGSAAAVAAGLVPLAVGTQTGGSVIRPAAFCGVAAIKPSFRLLPTVGVKTQAWTLDTLGLFAANVADLAHALQAISGRPMTREDGPPLPRFGIALPEPSGEPEPEMAQALDEATRRLGRMGCEVRRVDVPAPVAEGWHASGVIQAYEARIALGWEVENRAGLLPPRIAAVLADAERVSAGDYDAARARARRARTASRALFAEAGVDVLLTPSAPGPAPGRDTTGDPRFNRLWTLLGVPCVNVPGLCSGVLPLGLQVIAPFARDDLALAAAAVLEQALREG